MSAAIRTNFSRDTMPQIVPSVGFTPPYCDYAAFTTDFDLSLLPASPECEVPLSPSYLSPYLSLYPSSPPMFSGSLEDGILCDNVGFVSIKNKLEEDAKVARADVDDQPLHTPGGKSLSSSFFSEHMDTKEPIKKEDEKISPLIPTTIQASASYYPITIKQEPSYSLDFTPGSTVADFPKLVPSPYALKTEKTIDLQEALKESKYHLVKYGSPSQSKQYTTLQSLLKGGEDEDAPGRSDHQLLRSVLRDTSFQRKFNLKTFEIPQGLTEPKKEIKMEADERKEEEGEEMEEELTQEKMEPVFSLAIEQIQKEVDNACTLLGLPRDPSQWSSEDVKAWLMWTVRQYSLPIINVESFDMDGLAFSRLSEEEFQQRTPQCGSTLHAHLEIWKATASCGDVATSAPVQEFSTIQWSPTMHSSGSSTGGDLSDEEDEDMELRTSAAQSASQSTPGTSTGTGSGLEKAPVKSRGGSSGSHIHLWQFLKELLASPQAHGSCIRWLDRQKGVFKIEDSVRVARLWGKRKNRPAMNYDKLSRSIRQYYKKGIMKKTERSQRLVYQFCHPYCL